jgi:hypothetical protein
MRLLTITFLLLALLLTSLDAGPKATVTVVGIRWYNSLEAAKQQAKREKKPILHMQMFGRIDDAYC